MLRGWGGSGGGAGTESPRKLGCVIAAIRPLLGLFPAAAAAGPWKDRAGGLRARRSRETAAGGTGAGRERGGGRWVPPPAPRHEEGPTRNRGKACGSGGARRGSGGPEVGFGAGRASRKRESGGPEVQVGGVKTARVPRKWDGGPGNRERGGSWARDGPEMETREPLV